MSRPLYPLLRLYFIGSLLALAENFIPSSENILYGAPFLNFIRLCVFIGSLILQLYALSKLRFLSRRMQQAFRYTVISIVGIMILTLFLLASLLSPNGLPLVILSLILLVGFAILSMIADYQFYWGLGETIVPNEYDFSEDRLHWAFYWKLIALPVVFLAELSKVPLLPTICSLIFSSLSLFILYQFSQVVQQKEE